MPAPAHFNNITRAYRFLRSGYRITALAGFGGDLITDAEQLDASAAGMLRLQQREGEFIGHRSKNLDQLAWLLLFNLFYR